METGTEKVRDRDRETERDRETDRDRGRGRDREAERRTDRYIQTIAPLSDQFFLSQVML